MAYTIPQIIQWAKIAQPLAFINERKKLSKSDNSADVNLDIKLYNTRKDVEYAYAQNADADIQYIIGNYLLALMGVYLFEAQSISGSGGSISPITPSSSPDEYDFEVSATSFIATGESSKTLPTSWQGANILFVRNNVTQSKVNQGGAYFSWDKITRLFTLINGDANEEELFQIYPII